MLSQSWQKVCIAVGRCGGDDVLLVLLVPIVPLAVKVVAGAVLAVHQSRTRGGRRLGGHRVLLHVSACNAPHKCLPQKQS